MKIMVGYDGSEMSRRALAAAQKRAKALDAELHVFTAVGNGEKTKAARLLSELKEAEMLCTACSINCRVQVSDDNLPVAESILHYADENHIDEIVVGLRRRSQLGKFIFGSTTRQIILEATCPVLTVK